MKESFDKRPHLSLSESSIKKALFFLILLIILFLVILCRRRKAPNFRLNTNMDYYSYLQKGNNILFFWSAYCPHCKETLKLFEENSNDWLNNHLLTVSIDDTKKEVEDWAGKVPLYLDFDKSISKLYNIENIPTAFIVNKHGDIVEKGVGEKAASFLINKYYLRE